MKKTLLLLLALTLLWGLASCSRPVEVGIVTVRTGVGDYTPAAYPIFMQSRDGTVTDSARQQPMEVLGELPIIPLFGELEILLDGETAGTPAYTLYDSDGGEVYWRQEVFSLPQESGSYVVSLEVTWGNDREFYGYQYLFRLATESCPAPE
ncbi:MAG: hypothetical protein ACK5LX_07400 [Oscillospiraceae bacterium]